MRLATWRVQEFWDAVEAEVRRPDPAELECFLSADGLPIRIRPEFEAALLEGILFQPSI